MEYFAESTMPAVIVGISLAFIFLTVYVGTRKTWVMLAGVIAVPAVVVGLVMLEKAWVTDREEVSDTIYRAARAIETNDVGKVIAFCEPDSMVPKLMATAQMGLFHVDSIKVNSLKVEVNTLISPPTAQLKFVAVVRGHGTGVTELGQIPQGVYPLDFEVEMRKHGDRWLATDNVSFKRKGF